MRLIDADTLIHELNNSHYPGAPYVDAGISIAIGKVCDAPTIEPERKTGRWIPVSEKAYPDKEGKYLVTDDAGGMATVDVDDFIYCDDGSGMWLCSQNVTAWMLAPESYQEERRADEQTND